MENVDYWGYACRVSVRETLVCPAPSVSDPQGPPYLSHFYLEHNIDDETGLFLC